MTGRVAHTRVTAEALAVGKVSSRGHSHQRLLAEVMASVAPADMSIAVGFVRQSLRTKACAGKIVFLIAT